MGKSLYCDFLRERTGEVGQVGLGVASLNNYSRLWGIGAVHSYLGCLGQADSGGNVSPIEEMVVGMG